MACHDQQIKIDETLHFRLRYDIIVCVIAIILIKAEEILLCS